MDKELVREWLKFADRNLAIAEHLAAVFRPTPLEDICFNCQQAAEKYLKGYLIAAGELPPKTHNLMELCSLCEHYDASFARILKLCTLLNRFSVLPRYPMESYIDEALMQRALRYAAEIKAFPPLAQLRKEMEDSQ